jgi:putative transposase/transposase-like zinc-binding protein
MKYRNPLRQILSRRTSHWDRDEFPPAARQAFRSAQQCRTPALGGEVYASQSQERIVYHTCKGRACTSCGHRTTIQWQREWWVMLPDVPYKGITFTMPKELWQIFGDNRQLVQALPALAATVIQTWASARYSLRVGVIAVLHTFNGRLEFNPHVHTMVTAGGLDAVPGSWLPSVYYDQLMEFWRAGVIMLLRTALRSGLVRTDMSHEKTEALLTKQESRWWSIRIQSFDSREHFLRYAGRYVRRPPIAQRRITYIGDRKLDGFASSEIIPDSRKAWK